MKKIIIIAVMLAVSMQLYSDPYISGEFYLYDTVTLSDASELSLINSAQAYLKLDMNVNSNGVKFYFEEIFDNYTDESGDITATLNKAYLKYRLPYKENYMNLQLGKSYYSMGGGSLYNAGNSLLKDSTGVYILPTNWNAVLDIPVYETSDYRTMHLGFIAVLPIEDDSSSIGSFVNYEIGNEYFDTVEMNFITDLSSTPLSFGYNGTLYFDYGLYFKTNLQDIERFDTSLFLIKVYDKTTLNVESLYQNKSTNFNYVDRRLLYVTPTLSYAFDDKTTISASNVTLLTLDEISDSINTLTLSLTYSIVQGFDLSTSIYTYFMKENLIGLAFSSQYDF
ncbi:MAG: hypothetical protein ACRQFF_05995 [Sphaerochaeta sp.]